MSISLSLTAAENAQAAISPFVIIQYPLPFERKSFALLQEKYGVILPSIFERISASIVLNSQSDGKSGISAETLLNSKKYLRSISIFSLSLKKDFILSSSVNKIKRRGFISFLSEMISYISSRKVLSYSPEINANPL